VKPKNAVQLNHRVPLKRSSTVQNKKRRLVDANVGESKEEERRMDGWRN
jgi:hypothetical protein